MRSHAALSSKNTSWSALHPPSLVIHSSRKGWFRCFATRIPFFRFHTSFFRAREIVDSTSTSWNSSHRNHDISSWKAVGRCSRYSSNAFWCMQFSFFGRPDAKWGLTTSPNSSQLRRIFRNWRTDISVTSRICLSSFPDSKLNHISWRTEGAAWSRFVGGPPPKKNDVQKKVQSLAHGSIFAPYMKPNVIAIPLAISNTKLQNSSNDIANHNTALKEDIWTDISPPPTRAPQNKEASISEASNNTIIGWTVVLARPPNALMPHPPLISPNKPSKKVRKGLISISPSLISEDLPI